MSIFDFLDEHKIKYTNKDLIEQAFIHSSYVNEHKVSSGNNERLEFIGDAYVDAVVGAKLFEMMGSAHEGALSRCRADVVCEDSLAGAAEEMRLGGFLFLGKGEESSGGRKKASILADAFEALMGAIILDGGYEAGSDAILRLLGQRIKLGAQGKLNKDFKTRLQEKLQEEHHNVRIEYRKVAESGPDHNKTFTIEVEVNGKAAGRGTGPSKAKAEQAAAEDALSKGV